MKCPGASLWDWQTPEWVSWSPSSPPQLCWVSARCPLLEMFPLGNLSLELEPQVAPELSHPTASARNRWRKSCRAGPDLSRQQLHEMTALSPPLTVVLEKSRKRGRMPQWGWKEGASLLLLTWELVTAMTKWLPLALNTFFSCCWSEFGRQTVHKIDL